MKLPERQQLIIVAIAMAIICGFGAGRLYPLSRESLELKKIRASQEVESAKVDQYGAMLPAFRQRVQELEEETADFDVRIPGDRRFADLWQRMADVMNRHNLTDQIVQPGGEIVGERVNRIPIKIQCTGTVSQIFAMLGSLDEFERTIRIEKLELSSDDEFSGQVKLDAQANVYYHHAVNKNT